MVLEEIVWWEALWVETLFGFAAAGLGMMGSGVGCFVVGMAVAESFPSVSPMVIGVVV
jgi:hypothetical protein